MVDLSQFDAFIHIDAEDPQYVYKWRLQQEETTRAQKGSGMTDEQVKHFVDGCTLSKLRHDKPVLHRPG